VKYVLNENEDEDVELKNLHKECALGVHVINKETGEVGPPVYATLKEAAVCTACNNAVLGPRSSPDVIKGHRTEDGFVTITSDQIKQLESAKSKTMTIEAFVPAVKVDRFRVRTNVILGPTELSGKPYVMLRDQMLEDGVVAIVRYNGWGHDKIGALTATTDGCFILSEFYMSNRWRHFATQNRAPKVEYTVTDKERALAKSLIETYQEDFVDLTTFTDGKHDRLKKLINDLREGKAPTFDAPEPEAPPVVDLLAALQESIAARKAHKEKVPDKKGPAKAPAKTAAPTAPTKKKGRAA
jgi:DNA end-binding protein Ku